MVTVIVAVVMLLWAPAAALAHDDFKTPRGHMLEDAVAHTPATERALVRQTARTTASDAQVAAAAVAALPQDVGTWGPVVPWPVVGVHVALLPNGKVLAYDSVGDAAAEKFTVHDHTRATVYDPAKGTFTPVNVSAFNIFCSGAAHLADGSIFVAGGNLNAQLQGIVQTHLFNPVTNTWSRGPNMAAARWYPTVTALPNGEMLITEGGPDVPEVRTTAGSLRRLTSASQDLPLYPWMDVGPDGRTYYTGPNQTMRALQPSGTGSWTTFGQRDAINRTYGGHAMYDVGRILVAGGGASSRDARVINVNGASPTVSATAPMAFGRRQHNLTMLADGSVLATGGNSSGADLVDLNNGVYAAELWNPATGTWRTLEAMRTTRQYHSTALLLPDARVLVSGGGLCDTCDAAGYLAKNAETFTPPYLYKKDGSGALAPRPSIASAPTTVRYGAPFSISTPEAASIAKVALIRLGAVTHSVNMEQRYVPLSFTRATGTVTATAPANANIAPTGMYMLFVTDANGVPSVAKMVSVAPGAGGSAPTVTLTQPANGATFTAPATVNLAATASDADGTISRVEFFNGSVKIGEDLTAPYTFAWTGVGAGTYSITARATDNSGASATSAAASITVRSSTTPPPAGTNVAPSAAVTASSETASTGALAIKAVDGDTRGYPTAPDREWATLGQKAGAWLNLAWAAPQRIGSVTLYDRPNLNDHVTGATLTFSDGSTVSTGVLNNNGAATTITFPARTTTSLRFTVTSAAMTTVNIGLAEIQAFTAP